MDKVDEDYLQCFGYPAGPGPADEEDESSGADLKIDQRVTQFLQLLRELDECTGGLEALPTPELSEVVSSALGVCGLVDPNERREVIVKVLETIERVGPMPERSKFGLGPVRRN